MRCSLCMSSKAKNAMQMSEDGRRCVKHIRLNAAPSDTIKGRSHDALFIITASNYTWVNIPSLVLN